MVYIILFEYYGGGEGSSEPKGLFGPFAAEEDAFFEASEHRLKRIYGISSYNELKYEMMVPQKDLDFKDKVRESDKVRLNDDTSEFNTQLGTVEIISETLNSAAVMFNKRRSIVRLDRLEIIYA